MYFISIFYNIICKLILIYINHQYIFNKISFVNIEINSLLKIMIYKYSDLFSKTSIYIY